MWKWVRYYTGEYQDVLFVNIDETSIPIGQGNQRGNVFGHRARVVRPVKKTRQSRLTHVAILCDQLDVQQRLPQVLIGNRVAFQQRKMQALRAACGENVILYRCFETFIFYKICDISHRQNSAWNNGRYDRVCF